MYIQTDPEALFVQLHTEHKRLITVSKSRASACEALLKFGLEWSGHVAIQNTTTTIGTFFYLGKYRIGAARRMTRDEYLLLPEKVRVYFFSALGKHLLMASAQTKAYVLKYARMFDSYRNWTQAELVQSLTEFNGLYVGKTEMRLLEYSTAVEAKLRQEAGQKGYA